MVPVLARVDAGLGEDVVQMGAALLVAGGLFLLPVALLVEGAQPAEPQRASLLRRAWNAVF